MKTPLLPTRLFAPIQKATQFFAGLSIATGLMSLSVPAQAAPQMAQRNATVQTSLPNGVYLYGQASEPGQIGRAYFVFEVRQGKLLGALYMPRSSFDCTYGSVQSDKLALTVIDSYEKSENPYAIAVERNAVAGQNPGVAPIGLEGFQKLDKVSENDQRILNVCKTNYQSRVWK